MDFLFGLPRTPASYDSIWVIVDKLTKTAKFLSVKVTFTLDQLAKLYVDRINEVGERKLLGPKLVQQTSNNVKIIRDNLKTARDRKKSYADKWRKELEFEVGDKVFLKLFPWKEILRFGRKGKLSPRYIRPYEIIERVGPMTYRLDLPPELSRIRDVFHLAMLRKYVSNPTHVLPEQPVQLKENFSYEEVPMEILDRKEQVFKK
ncbi:uncharacterized protein LOC120071979 [Benincasa hispida]|uniref:uncharacterized protein LOC120071979 n=1 Tax=Benincasa hispida TaxID=102211 RepID=UPI001901BBF9|nr:uncharacterized protein LOC120071979 [Benincasa hispida]